MAMMLAGCVAAGRKETLAPLADNKAPQSFDALWAGFDPRAEPLDVEVLKEWEHEGVVLKVLRYRIGIFKGKKAMMAAVYGYPKGGKNLPGLVQIHGGGQFADWQACVSNGKRGYATISLAWAGRLNAPDYRVHTPVVKLFWENKSDNPKYRVTTDWGALEAYHSPCRFKGSNFVMNPPSESTLDPVPSPRNSGWFLCTIAARRALTFLEKQKVVDENRLGVYGHSMGGKVTVMTAGCDERVKAAAPSCGGISDRRNADAMYAVAITDDHYLKRIACPIFFLSPSNDFHGRIDDLQTAVGEIRSEEWRITCSPHHNHQDTAPHEVATQLWFDQVLMRRFETPKTPNVRLALKTGDGIPRLSVSPDASMPILGVDVFYTCQGRTDKGRNDRVNNINRFWHHATAEKKGDAWTAVVPILSTDKPLWVYANVHYPLAEPVAGAGYYYGAYTAKTFTLSSRMRMVRPAKLKAAGVRATLKPSMVIEDFKGDWQKEWFIYSNDPKKWERKTHKVYDDRYKAPAFAKLAFAVKAQKGKKLVIGLDSHTAVVELEGGPEWQEVLLYPSDFKDAEGKTLAGWDGIKELRFAPLEHRRHKGKTESLGAEWQGAKPVFRSMRWVKGTKKEIRARLRH